MRAFALVVIVAAIGAAACSDITSRPKFEDPTPAPLQATLTTEPPADASGVPRDAIIRVVLDDYPDPDSVSFGPVLLRSGRVNFDATLRVDLVGRAIVFVPRSPLEAMTTYEVILDGTVRALSGRVMGRSTAFQFTVGTTRVPDLPARAKLTWTGDIQPELTKWAPIDPGCPLAADGCAPCCHSRISTSGSPRTPSRLLDLTAGALADDPIYGVVNTPSVGLSGTPYQLRRVAPADSARSLFLRKLIGGNHHEASHDPPYPDLRVDGRRMPILLNHDAGEPLDEMALRKIQQWIDDGAAL